MKLAASNIAWPRACEVDAMRLLASRGVRGIEVAPTRVWPDWTGASETSARALGARLRDEGFAIPALQSLLFGKPDLQLFGDARQGAALAGHLRFCAELAAACGAGRMVFGSPANRKRGTLDDASADALAADFFAGVAQQIAALDVVLTFEPNPAIYGCDFATDSESAARLVRRTASEAFRLQLDTGALAAGRETAADVVRECAAIIGHVHASEPHLAPFADSGAHRSTAAALAEAGYDGWITLEMRETADPMRDLERSLTILEAAYRDDD